VQISPTFFQTFLCKQEAKLFWQMAFGKWQTDLANGALIW